MNTPYLTAAILSAVLFTILESRFKMYAKFWRFVSVKINVSQRFRLMVDLLVFFALVAVSSLIIFSILNLLFALTDPWNSVIRGIHVGAMIAGAPIGSVKLGASEPPKK